MICIREDRCGGAPTIGASRMPVWIVLESIMRAVRHGALADVREDYPQLTDEQIAECIEFASRAMQRIYGGRDASIPEDDWKLEEEPLGGGEKCR